MFLRCISSTGVERIMRSNAVRPITMLGWRCNVRWTLLIIGLVAVALLPAPALAEITGRVVQVLDGDTIEVIDASNTRHTVRLAGIDAPERGQPYGNTSHEYLAGLLDGRQVVVSATRSDRYGRLCGTVTVDDSNASLEQLRAGMARWYLYDRRNQSRSEQAALRDAETSAKENAIGLWAGAE